MLALARYSGTGMAGKRENPVAQAMVRMRARVSSAPRAARRSPAKRENQGILKRHGWRRAEHGGGVFIVLIGQLLTEVKARLGHGKFLTWIEKEFMWKEWTAQQFMKVYRQFKTVNFTDLQIDVSALYLIAAPKTPEPVRAETLRRAEAGESISLRTSDQKTPLAEIFDVRAMAKAAEQFLKEAQNAGKLANEASEIRFRAERKACEELQRMKERGERAKAGSNQWSLRNATTIADLGIEKTQSHRWQRIAEVPEPIFEEYIQREKEREAGDFSAVKLLNEAKLAKRDELAEQIPKAPPPLPDGPFQVIVICSRPAFTPCP